MITINNNSIIFSKDEKYYEYLRRYLVKIYLIKNTNYFKYTATRTFTKYNIPEIDEQVNSLNRQLRQRPFDKGDQFYDVYYIYNLDDDDNLIVPIGLMEFVKPFFSKYVNINYNLNDRLIDTNKVISSLSDKLLDGITLREEQMKAIKLCLTLKRTIIQMGTGAGKSEVMCGFIKSIQNETGECPTTLLLEPTDKLKNEMIERFQKYGINAIDYGKKRQIIKNAVNITHPMSLNNDLEKDGSLLKDIKVYMCDECLERKSKILLPNNKLATIEEIYNNPYITEVMSYNFEKNIYEPKKILRKIKTPFNDKFWKIEYMNPVTQKIEYLKCTNNHKIWTKNRGYVKCDELTTDDLIKIDTNMNNKTYICKICDKQYNNVNSFGGHMAMHNPENLEKSKQRMIQLNKEGKNPLKNPEKFKKAMESRSKNEKYRKYLSDRMKGDNNPSKRKEVKEKISKAIIKRRQENPEFLQKCLKNFNLAPYKSGKKKLITKVEQQIINMNIPNLTYTGDGKYYFTFKNGKHKNPDFIYKNSDEIKIVEVGDIHYWHTLDEIEEVKKQYKEIGLDCLYLTNDDLKNLDEAEGRIRKFLFNHHVHPINITKNTKISQFKYNLEIEDNHNYWANGILVSNCHHNSAKTYAYTILNIPNAEYTIGVSASAVSQEHINEKNITNYDIGEIETMGMIGTVSMNVTAADLIKGSKLAKPVLLIVNNLANEVLDKKKQNDWHEINKKKLQSPKRTREIAEMSVFFSKRNRKTLILVNTKDYAYNIAKVINELGLNDQCRLSFGGKVFLKYNSTLGEFEKDDSDTFEDYRSGKISILIGTQHLVEGVDVPSLDTVILAYCGKSERIQIQSCGRVLRLTKNGNMAYIVDFSDCKDPILSYQFKTRLKTYLTTIGVNRNDVYVVNPEKIEEETSIIFNKYEN